MELTSVPLTPQTLTQSDCVIIVTDHSAVDYGMVAQHAPIVVDTRHVLRRKPS
jgi:UDP-N-acetyl-D-glucosamine dehydrogenase